MFFFWGGEGGPVYFSARAAKNQVVSYHTKNFKTTGRQFSFKGLFGFHVSGPEGNLLCHPNGEHQASPPPATGMEHARLGEDVSSFEGRLGAAMARRAAKAAKERRTRVLHLGSPKFSLFAGGVHHLLVAEFPS